MRKLVLFILSSSQTCISVSTLTEQFSTVSGIVHLNINRRCCKFIKKSFSLRTKWAGIFTLFFSTLGLVRFYLNPMQSFSYCFLLNGSRPFPPGRTNLSSLHRQLWVKHFIFLFSGSVFHILQSAGLWKNLSSDKVDISQSVIHRTGKCALLGMSLSKIYGHLIGL